GPLREPRGEVLVTEAQQLRLRHRGHVRGARARIEQRQLADDLAGSDDRQEVLAAIGRFASDLELAGRDDVQLIARIALAEEHGPAPDAARLHVFEQRAGRLVVEPGEERGPAYDFDVHLVPPDRFTSAAQSTLTPVLLPNVHAADPGTSAVGAHPRHR